MWNRLFRVTSLSLILVISTGVVSSKGGLTRDAALRILNQNANRLLPAARTLTVLRSPLYVSHQFASQEELAGGPITPLPLHAEIDGLGHEQAYWTAREQRIQEWYLLALAQAGIIKKVRVENTAPSGRTAGIRIYFSWGAPTPEITWIPSSDNPGHYSVEAVASRAGFHAVTGITGEGSGRGVEVTVRSHATDSLKRIQEFATKFANEHLGGADAYRNSCENYSSYGYLCGALQFQVPRDETKRYNFQLFDDGWRLSTDQ